MNAPNGIASHLVLAGVWIVWCCMHSALIAPGLMAYVQQHHPKQTRYYRLLYNVIAVMTLIPVLGFSLHLQTEPFFRWSGLARMGQIGMLLAAFYLFGPVPAIMICCSFWDFGIYTPMTPAVWSPPTANWKKPEF